MGQNIGSPVAYKRPFQKATFNKLLKSSALAETYITNNTYLSRGHLAPDADFLFASWQYATYFYINTNPQWQKINGGNWKNLEIIVRKQAELRNTQLKIYTGSHGVLQLPDIKNNLVDIYLLPKNILPVPKYFWKILYDEKTHQAIVLINLNNPTVKQIPSGTIFCTNICKIFGWARKSWNKPNKGLIFCCSYEEFRKTVLTVPKIKVNGVLEMIT